MANAENKPGLLIKGAEKLQKLNKITLVGGVAAGIVGIYTGMPWLVTLGFGSALVDGAQILVLRDFKNQKKSHKMQAA